MAQINIRMDDKLKEQAEIIFDELGLSLTTAFNMFVKQTIRQGGIPFEVTTRVDPFYSVSNIKALKESIEQANAGKFVSKTIEELQAMEE